MSKLWKILGYIKMAAQVAAALEELIPAKSMGGAKKIAAQLIMSMLSAPDTTDDATLQSGAIDAAVGLLNAANWPKAVEVPKP